MPVGRRLSRHVISSRRVGRLNELHYLPKLNRMPVSPWFDYEWCTGHELRQAGHRPQRPRFELRPAGHAAHPAHGIGVNRRQLNSRGFFGGVSKHVADHYKQFLYGNATLQNLPDTPRFVFNATSLQTGVLWRFSKPYIGDYKVRPGR